MNTGNKFRETLEERKDTRNLGNKRNDTETDLMEEQNRNPDPGDNQRGKVSKSLRKCRKLRNIQGSKAGHK